MQDITISDEYIRLGQALKLSGFAQSGVDAKVRIENGDVTVNGEVETRRGKKLRDGDVVAMDGNSFTVHSKLADKA
jgi:ribosome-associated protein